MFNDEKPINWSTKFELSPDVIPLLQSKTNNKYMKTQAMCFLFLGRNAWIQVKQGHLCVKVFFFCSPFHFYISYGIVFHDNAGLPYHLDNAQLRDLNELNVNFKLYLAAVIRRTRIRKLSIVSWDGGEGGVGIFLMIRNA